MKILEVKSLVFPEVKVIRFGRFLDRRGYFSEPWRESDFRGKPELDFIRNVNFVQSNESYSRKGTARGLHFQWNPYVGKLVRTVFGHMIDVAMDIRKNSLAYGKAIMYNMPQDPRNDFSEWIWLPPGFAHGNFYLEETAIEYFCSGEYNPDCEEGISPLSKDIDWSLCESGLHKKFVQVLKSPGLLISDKDRGGLTVQAWAKDPRSQNFL